MSHTTRVSLAAALGEHSAPSTLFRVQNRLRASAARTGQLLAFPASTIGLRCDFAEGTTDRDRGQAA